MDTASKKVRRNPTISNGFKLKSIIWICVHRAAVKAINATLGFSIMRHSSATTTSHQNSSVEITTGIQS